jgi:dienelactone hydrolase
MLRPMTKKLLLLLQWLAGLAVLLLAGLFFCAQWYRAVDHTDNLLSARAQWFEATERELADSAGGRAVAFTLTDNLGRVVEGHLSFPDTASGPLPAVLILGGHGTGARAVELVRLGHPAVLCGMNYPDLPEYRVHPLKIPSLLFSLDSLVSDAAANAFTVIDYLLSRPEVDPHRLTVLGASFGVPFAVIVGLDSRVGGMVLIYGGADLERVIEWNLRRRISSGPLRKAACYLLGTFTVAYEPSRYLAQFSPRPVLLVNGSDDTKIPQESVRLLYRTAGEPKEQLWVSGGHIHPNNRKLIGQLTTAISSWMERHGLY